MTKEAATIDKILSSLFKEMKRRGITQKEVAARAGFSPVTLTHWKQGKCYPSILAVHCLAQALGKELVLIPTARS